MPFTVTSEPSLQTCLTLYDRLESILAKGTLGPRKLDEIKLKLNVLSAFVKEEEEAPEKLPRADDEL